MGPLLVVGRPKYEGGMAKHRMGCVGPVYIYSARLLYTTITWLFVHANSTYKMLKSTVEVGLVQIEYYSN